MKMSKYHSRKTVIDGIKFDSIKEGKRYITLKVLERAKKVRDLTLQPKFLLQDKFRYNGEAIRAINYKADFKYYDIEKGIWIIEDVKASKEFQTDVYKLKKKLLLFKYPEINFIETY